MAFVIASALLTVLMLPNPWAIAAGLVFGLAAGGSTYGMLAGRELATQRRTAELTTEQAALSEHLDGIEATVRTRSTEFPPSTHGQLRMMVVGLREIVHRWETLQRAPEQQDAVAQTVRRHLPRTLELFLGLPNSAKPQYAEEFKQQIGVMAEAVAKTRDHVVARDLAALKNNRMLLEESLTDPDERLFKEHGL